MRSNRRLFDYFKMGHQKSSEEAIKTWTWKHGTKRMCPIQSLQLPNMQEHDPNVCFISYPRWSPYDCYSSVRIMTNPVLVTIIILYLRWLCVHCFVLWLSWSSSAVCVFWRIEKKMQTIVLSWYRIMFAKFYARHTKNSRGIGLVFQYLLRSQLLVLYQQWAPCYRGLLSFARLPDHHYHHLLIEH